MHKTIAAFWREQPAFYPQMLKTRAAKPTAATNTLLLYKEIGFASNALGARRQKVQKYTNPAAGHKKRAGPLEEACPPTCQKSMSCRANARILSGFDLWGFLGGNPLNRRRHLCYLGAAGDLLFCLLLFRRKKSKAARFARRKSLSLRRTRGETPWQPPKVKTPNHICVGFQKEFFDTLTGRPLGGGLPA